MGYLANFSSLCINGASQHKKVFYQYAGLTKVHSHVLTGTQECTDEIFIETKQMHLLY